MKKRILAIMLACFMVISLLPMNVFAEDAEIKCPGEESTHTAENSTCTVVKVVAPTCNDWGYTVYTCDGCGELFVDDITENKGDHNAEGVVEHVDATCTETGVVGGTYCTVCGAGKAAAEEVIPALGHDEVVTKTGEEGTCKAVVTCTRCDYNVETVGEHVWDDVITVIVDPNEAALENGWAVHQCVVCGEFSEKFPILCHECTKYAQPVAGKDATCTEDGVKDSWKCTVCDRQYAEIDGEVVVIESEEDLVIEALGHVDSNVVVFEEVFELAAVDKNDSSTWTTWVIPYDCEITFSDAEATGHFVIYVNGKWTVNLNQKADRTWTTELKAGTVIAFKNYNATDLAVTYTVEAYLLDVVGNCQSKDITQYTCERCGELIVTEVTGAHELIVYASIDATCTTNGYYAYGCQVAGCDHYDIVYTPALGHIAGEAVVENEVDPTCTEAGSYDLVVYCETCGEELSRETITVEALGHDLETVVLTPATCAVKEVTQVQCTRCDYCEDEVVGETNDQHNPEDMANGVVNPATCTKDGNRLYYCTWCSEWIAEDIPATNHAHTVTYVQYDCAPDYYDGSEEGVDGPFVYTCTYCFDCDTYLSETTELVDREFLVVYDSIEAAQADHCYGGYEEYSCTCGDEKCPFLEQYEDYVWHYEGDLIDCDYMRDATCTISGLHLYQCEWCEVFLVVEEPALGHSQSYTIEFNKGDVLNFDYKINAVATYSNGLVITYTDSTSIATPLDGVAVITADADVVPAVEPTCTEPGCTESYTCARCGEEVGGEEIPALGHTNVTVEHKDATCTTDGVVGGTYCSVCEADKKAEVEAVIPATGHNYVVHCENLNTEYDAENYIDYLYSHVKCENCGDEVVVNFHRHHFVLSEELSTAPTCTTAGENVYVCSCGMSYTEEVERTYHRDENGEILVNQCFNNGKECVVCGKVMNKEHTLGEWNHVDATCQNGEYEIAFCEKCDYYEVNPIDETLGDHVWGEEEPVLDANGYETGVSIVGCIVCGETKLINAEDAVIFTPAVGEGVAVVGSELAVTITMSGNTVDVWGFDIDVNYNNENLKFTRYEFGANFTGYVQDNEDYISVAANAEVAATVTNEVVVTLYFEVLKSVDGEISVTPVMVTDPEYNTIEATGLATTYEVELMMDFYTDGVIDLKDVQAIYNYIVNGGDYSILGDVDMDGDIDLADLEAVYLHIVG